jgi:hypothetical protein
VSAEPAAADHAISAGSRVRELSDALPELLSSASRARIYDRRGKIESAKKRRDRVASSLLADVTSVQSVIALAQALRLRPDTEVIDWMQPAGLWIKFTDASGMPIVTLGLLRPGWLRWDPCGDLELTDHALVEDMISALGLATPDTS